eukprot:3091214-Rhodomonas_salina.1
MGDGVGTGSGRTSIDVTYIYVDLGQHGTPLWQHVTTLPLHGQLFHWPPSLPRPAVARGREGGRGSESEGGRE